MKKTSFILVCSLIFGWHYAVAQDDLSAMQVDSVETDALAATTELEAEIAAETKKQGSLIPQQPAVEVTADSLDFFESDKVKNQRQGAEWETEQQILNDLEQDRLSGEKRRANSFLNRSTQEPMLYEDPNAKGWYLSGNFGSLEYNSTDISHDQSLGFAIGTKMYRNFIFEGALTWSTLFIDDNAGPVFKMNQLNIAMALKSPLFAGEIFNGRVQPEAGIVASFTRRTLIPQSINQLLPEDNKEKVTNALDLGVTMGVDFNASRYFSLGLGYTYYFNLSDGGDSDFQTFDNSTNTYVRRAPVEESNYHQLAFNAKFKF